MPKAGYMHLDGTYIETKLMERLLNNMGKRRPTMLIGAPGQGKTMLARRMALGGVFRAPHHTITPTGLAGSPKDHSRCEAALAHNGILFLDEFPEFSKGSIEALWGIRHHEIEMISDPVSGRKIPANFWILGAMNPCACGWEGSARGCQCMGNLKERYLYRAIEMMELFDFDKINIRGEYWYDDHQFYVEMLDD